MTYHIAQAFLLHKKQFINSHIQNNQVVHQQPQNHGTFKPQYLGMEKFGKTKEMKKKIKVKDLVVIWNHHILF